MITDFGVMIKLTYYRNEDLVRVEVRPLAMRVFLKTPLNQDALIDETNKIVWFANQVGELDFNELIKKPSWWRDLDSTTGYVQV